MKPVFSIIMTSYNYEAFVRVAIESVIAQSFGDWELLVVDDASTDGSWEAICSFHDPRIRTHRHPENRGACAAYNHALSLARGDYIASLDSDDFFLPDKLQVQHDFLGANPGVGICGTFVTEIDSSGSALRSGTPHADWFNADRDLNEPASWIWENHLCHSGAVVRADLHRRLGPFDPMLTYTPDWQFWIRALIAGARFAVIDQPLVGYRSHGDNITHKQPAVALREHADTLSQLLIPWLKAKGRSELIERAVEGFVRHPQISASGELVGDVGSRLFGAGEPIATGTAALRLLVAMQAKCQGAMLDGAEFSGDVAQLRARLQEITAANAWHESQRDAWEALAGERDQAIVELTARIGKMHREIAERDASIVKIRRHWAVRVARALTGSKIL